MVLKIRKQLDNIHGPHTHTPENAYWGETGNGT